MCIVTDAAILLFADQDADAQTSRSVPVPLTMALPCHGVIVRCEEGIVGIQHRTPLIIVYNAHDRSYTSRVDYTYFYMSGCALCV